MTRQERFLKFVEENDDLALRTSHLDCQIAILRLLDDLAAAREDVARMRKQIADHEEAEASVCPEDVGFVEFIGVLQKRIEQLKTALVGVTPSYRVKGKCWCPIWLDTRSGHSDECKAARALAIDSARAGGGR